jgi:CheY-like chemotaxis protein
MGPLLVLRPERVFNHAMSSTPQPLIVAVDDEQDDIFFLRHAIQKTGVPHRFQAFGNGEAAVNGLTSMLELENAVGLPLVCFVDIKMAAMNGFDLLRWIRTQRPLDAVPVLMFSSSDDPRDVDMARELGAQGYLKKYPSPTAMEAVLKEAKDFALLAPPKKSFVQWSYRFIDSSDAVPAK